MNDDISPLEPDQLDELLSAALDGEIDAAARDLGLSVDDVEARIAATPGAAERRDALTAARAALAEQPEIEELLAARLRTKAVRAAEQENERRDRDRRRRRNRVLGGLSGIAAAIVVVVAVAAGLSTHSTSGAKSASAPIAQASKGRAATTAPAKRALASTLGSFTDVHALAVAAVQRDDTTLGRAQNDNAVGLNTSSTTTAPGKNFGQQATTSAKAAASSSVPATKSTRLAGNSKSDANQVVVPAFDGTVAHPPTATTACTAPAQLLVGSLAGRLVLSTTATLSGKPVVVLVYAGHNEHSVWIEDLDCTVLSVQMLS